MAEQPAERPAEFPGDGRPDLAPAAPATDWHTVLAEALVEEQNPVGAAPPAPPPSPADPPYVWPHGYHYVSGPAGSGKTYLTRERMRQSEPGSVILMATTGIAAINLGDAVTINSQLGYYDTNDLVQSFTHGRLQQRLRRLRMAGVRRLILDEVSMMEAEQLSVLVRALEELNTESEVVLDPDSALGLTLVGDFLQLPPVQGKFAFQSPEWWRFEPGVETLTEIRRQGDQDFIRALRAARAGEADALCDYFGPRLHKVADRDFQAPTVLAVNKAVDRLNIHRHGELPGIPEQFLTRAWGKPRSEWKQIPAVLHLKPRARVMILANRYEGEAGDRALVYANGDLGTFMGVDQARNAMVELDRNKAVVPVKWVTRQNKVATGAKGVRKDAYDILGEITYLPLRLAYATTVHKTQGLTLDAVQIDIADNFFRSPGMLYVALSRARTIEGLRVVGTVDMLRHRCTTNPEVDQWR